MPIHVNVDNFARAESDRMFAALLQRTGGVGIWAHDRAFAPLDQQPVIRQNRDTLYSICVADISDGATLTLPDGRARYVAARRHGLEPGPIPAGRPRRDRVQPVVRGVRNDRSPVDGRATPRR